MKNLIIIFMFFCQIILPQEKLLKGKVIDSENLTPLPNANVYIEGKNIGVTTQPDGQFLFKGNISSEDILVVSYVGYSTAKIYLKNINTEDSITVKLQPKVIPSQTVLVEGSIGKEGVSPLAFSKITQKEIQQNYVVQDVPEYLSKLPSTTFYSENGNGIGYNYLTIRGFDQRRISVSVNGIPQNDPEDHNVYWLDMPDLLGNTAVIQVQRGAGSGIIGYPAIGGSINIITSTFSNNPQIDFSSSLGSYNTRKYSASFASGLIGNKYSIYAKLSQILSSGYRDNSWVQYDAYYLSAVRYDDNITTQINLYGGPIADGLAYTGLPKFAIKDKNLRRANYSDWGEDSSGYTYNVLRRPSEIENFTQPHFELLNEFKINPSVTLNSALFLVIGNGFFDFDGSWADTTYLRLKSQNGFHPFSNPQNVLIKAEVDNTQIGWVPRVSIKHDNGELIVGGEVRIHRSIHWGSIDFGQELPDGLSKNYRYYFYNGAKDIGNFYVHETYNLSNEINLLGEVQFAYHKYRFYNEKFLENEFSVSNLFVNPRIGINYKLNNEQNIFFSFARVSNEPRLSDYYNADESSGGATPQFELNPDGTYNYSKPLVNPETMNDFELGTSFIDKEFNASLNLYYMLFQNEIVDNGKVDIYGQPIIGNMKSTVHAGIEFSSNLHLTKQVSLYLNATLSSNKILNGTYFIDAVRYIDLNGNSINGFPNFLTNFGINFNDNGLLVQLTGRYVGKFYSDNFDENLKNYLQEFPAFVPYNDNVNDAYFTADFFASYELQNFSSLRSSKIFVQVNNIFDNLFSANAIGQYFFPWAERNFIAGINLGI
ncbi:MAG: TonB-dependent receptor [Bacteroidetes bacterium]|nr:TonB-dependent receptor [Bacteroidota bacterium]